MPSYLSTNSVHKWLGLGVGHFDGAKERGVCENFVFVHVQSTVRDITSSFIHCFNGTFLKINTTRFPWAQGSLVRDKIKQKIFNLFADSKHCP